MKLRLCYLLIILSQLGYGQFANKSFYLVDSLELSALYEDDKLVIDSILKIYHLEKEDTLKINQILYLTETLEGENAWMPYNLFMLHFSENKLAGAPEEAEKNYYKRTLAGAYNNLGFAANTAGKPDKALIYFSSSKTLLEETGQKQGLSDVYNNIGLIYKNLSQTSKSLDYYFKCLKICDELKDTRGKAASYNNIGMLYVDLQDYTKGLEYMTKANAEWETLKNKKGMASTLGNLGLIYEKLGDVNLSLNYYAKALVLNEKTNDQKGIATSLGYIGWVYLKQSNYIKAQDYFERSLLYRKIAKDNAGVAYALFNLGSLYRLMNKNAQAKEYALKTLEIGQQLGYPDIIKKASHLIYLIEKEKGNTKLALEMHELYVTMRDSLFNEQSQKVGLKKQYQYEFELKENELKAAQEKREIILNDEIKRQRIIFISSLLGGVVFLIFSIILYQRFRVIKKQNLIIEEQKTEIKNAFAGLHTKNKEVLDSIYYAKRIQNALITSDLFFKKHFSFDYFTLYKPKDIISGDFYWAIKKNNRFYLAVCDSTGHGVPGAFMSLLNIGFLSEAINEKDLIKPSEILNYVREKLISNLGKDEQNDGFDGVLVCFEDNSSSMTYAAANSKPFLIRDSKLLELSYDKMPVGNGISLEPFNLYTQIIESNDQLYLLTDGYADQFGGPEGKKYKTKQLKQTLLSISDRPLTDQHKFLNTEFEKWKSWNSEIGLKNTLEQVDDVCLFGIKFT